MKIMGKSNYRWVMRHAGEPLIREMFSPASPAADEVTVAVAGCGVCHTDLGFFYDGVRTKHELPLTLGHEISGRVVDTGPHTTDLLNRAVVVPAVIPCGTCDLCRRGLGNICRGQKMPGNDIQGGFATHVTVPARGICMVDEERLTDAGLELSEVSVLADAVTTPYQAVKLADVQSEDLVIVVGVGGVGGYAVQIAAAMDAIVVAVDIDQSRLDMLMDFGAALTINARDSDSRQIKKQVAAFAGERGLRATEWKIFECSGTPAGQNLAFDLLTFGSHLAVVGFTMEKPAVRLSNLMAFNARMQGNWGCLPEYYPAALELVLSGRVQMKPFVSLYPLSEINNVFEAAHAHRLDRRAVLVP